MSVFVIAFGLVGCAGGGADTPPARFTKGRESVTVLEYALARIPPKWQAVDAEDLVDIEELKQLKARYCRLLDAKDWQAWRQVFTDDFVSDTSKAGGKVIHGADDFVAFTRGSLEKRSQATAHQVHAPELELTSATTARGIWALEDVVRLAPGINLRGYGHYHETYEKLDGRWLIKSSTLTRLREDVFNVFVSVYVSDRIKRVGAGLARRITK